MTDKLIVLADLGRLKAYRVTHDSITSRTEVNMVYDCEFLEAHLREADRAGRDAAMGASGHHGLTDETERRLIRMMGEKISELVTGEKHWYLAAPERINARLMLHLRQPAREGLVKNLTADLVKVRKQELLDHFLAAAA